MPLARLRKVNSRRGTRNALNCSHLRRFSGLRIGVTILCRAYVFPWSRTTCTLPSEKPRPSCLARIFTVLQTAYILRISASRCGNFRSRTSMYAPCKFSARFLNCSHLRRFYGLRNYCVVVPCGLVTYVYVRSRRKSRVLRVLFASSPFYRLCIYFAFLRCVLCHTERSVSEVERISKKVKSNSEKGISAVKR